MPNRDLVSSVRASDNRPDAPSLTAFQLEQLDRSKKNAQLVFDRLGAPQRHEIDSGPERLP